MDILMNAFPLQFSITMMSYLEFWVNSKSRLKQPSSKCRWQMDGYFGKFTLLVFSSNLFLKFSYYGNW